MEKRNLQTRLFNPGRLFLILGMMVLLFMGGCSKETGVKPENPMTPTPAGAEEGTDGTVDDGTEAALSSGAQNEYQFRQPQKGDTCAEIVIQDYGSIFVRLFPKEAPKAVDNFTALAKEGYYDNMKINRVMADYLVQSGSPDGETGKSIYGGGFANEISDMLIPARGSLCMANQGSDGTNTSQFFLLQTKSKVIRSLADPLDNRYHMTFEDYLKEAYGTEMTKEELSRYEIYGGAPWLYGHHTVFGQIYQGYDILDKLNDVKVNSKLKPKPVVIIKTVRIFTFEG